MALKASTLRPGLLVSMKTSIQGNTRYSKRDLEEDHLTDAGERRARWETERTIKDPEEFVKATELRTKAIVAVRKVCAYSVFGLLCPDNLTAKLDETLVEMRNWVDEFNATAKVTRVHVYVLVGRIAPDDVEAVRAINAEVRDLIATMEQGISNLDCKAVRKAATEAQSLGSMLSDDARNRVQEAVDAARLAARRITAAGEQAAQEIDKVTMAKLAQARTAFLDIDISETEVKAPVTQAPTIDLAPTEGLDLAEGTITIGGGAIPVREIDIGD